MQHRYHIEGVCAGRNFSYNFPSGENTYSEEKAVETAKRLLNDPQNNMLRPITYAVLWDGATAYKRLVPTTSQN